MEELQEDHDAFGAVVGEEDGLEFFVTAAGDAHLVTGFQFYGVFGWRAELILTSLLELFDESISYGDRLFSECDQLVDSAG